MTELAVRWPDTWSEATLGTLPDDGHRYEIVDGSLLVTPPPIDRHQFVGAALLGILRATAPGGWQVAHDLGVRVPGGNLIPDIVALRPGHARGVVWREAVDVGLVVEIASPSTQTTDRSLKAVKYAEAGIPVFWQVAQNGTITVSALVAPGQYGIVETVRPGRSWTASVPFAVTFDPAEFLDDR